MSEAKNDDSGLTPLLYAGPELGEVRVGELDKSAKARTMPEYERRMMYFRGHYYRQFKHYKGMLCIGVSWEECDSAGVRI